MALISCSIDNDYGHPASETLERLKSFGLQLHRTDLEGEITIVSDGKGFQVTAQHEPTGSLWVGRTTKREEEKGRKGKKG